MTERNLIKGLKKGDYKSYEILFRMYYAKFVHYAESIVEDRDVAKDLVQEAFMKVWLNRNNLKENLSINNFLFVLVRRSALNFIRDRKIAESLDESLILVDNQEYIDDNIVQLESIIDSMPSQRRTVFKKSRQEGLRNKDIAQQMNLSEKTVERHITLAMNDLRRKLKS